MTKIIQRSEPAIEPVTLSEARDHLRLDVFGSPPSHPEDNLIELYISAARQLAEDYTGHSIAYSQSVAYFDSAPVPGDFLALEDWPIASVDAVQYVDSYGATQTWGSSNYTLDTASAPARLYAVSDWPDVKTSTPNILTVTYTAGYTDGNSPNNYPIPKAIKNAILLMVGHLYENRQQVGQKMESLPYGVEFLLNPHRINLGI